MKRIISIILALSTGLFLFTACGKTGDKTGSADSDVSEGSSEAEAEVNSDDAISFEDGVNSNTMSADEISAINKSSTAAPSAATPSKNQSAPLTTVKVEDYGGKADGKTNCANAFKQAVATCRNAEGKSVLQLSAGTYYINKDVQDGKKYESDYAIFMNAMVDFTLQGSTTGTTTIMVGDPSLGCLAMEDGVNVAIKNVAVDYSVVPYVQATVVSANSGTGAVVLDIETATGFPSFADPLFRADVMTGSYMLVADPKTDRSKSVFGPEAIMMGDDDRGTITDTSKAWTKISGNRWQVNVAAGSRGDISSAGLKAGSQVAVGAHRWVYGLKAYKNKNITVENVTFYSGPGTASTWGMNENITIKGVKVDIKPGSNRHMSILADGLHGFGNRGTMLVENCYFYGNGDDGINFHSRAGFVTSVVSGTKVKVNPSGTNEYRVGDEIHVMNTTQKTIRGIVKLTKVEVENTYSIILTFNKAVTGMVATNNNNTTDTIYNASACEQNAVIQNNTFNSNRGRHVLLRSHGVVLKNNTFNIGHGTWTSVLLEFAQDWGEGPAPYNINILNNTFNDASLRGNTGIITAPGTAATGAAGRTIHDINIEGNKFNNMSHVVIGLTGTDGATIKNNVINVAAAKTNSSLITATNCTGIKITGLTGTDPNPKTMTPALVLLQNSVVAGTAGYSSSGISFNFTHANKPALLTDLR